MEELKYSMRVRLDSLDESVTNILGQKVHFYTKGEDFCLIYAVSHDLKRIAKTDFFGTDDMMQGDDYCPVFLDNETTYTFEITDMNGKLKTEYEHLVKELVK